MSLLKKSAPALLYAGIATAAVGAAALSVAFRPAADHNATVHMNNDCQSILDNQKSASILQKLGCTMRHGYHFGIR